MKKLLLLIVVMTGWFAVYSQTTYHYPLKENFQANEVGAPVLIQIPNNSGLTGEFVTRTVPETACGMQGSAPGYFFEDDSGLEFDNPEGFIGQSYSLAFNFQVDEFISPPPWVRIVSFTHEDDVGIYIKLTDPPYRGTLDFWPYGLVGETNFFNPQSFYQLILVRNDEGLITIYVNGELFAEYDDSQSQAYVPQEPNHYIVFFRDSPSVLADEASPGFVSAIHLMNAAWTADEVANYWSQFCSSLLDIKESNATALSLYPNPARDYIHLDVPFNPEGSVIIRDITGRVMITLPLAEKQTTIDISILDRGLYLMTVKQKDQMSFIKFIKK
jgi:hypothetical protein